LINCGHGRGGGWGGSWILEIGGGKKKICGGPEAGNWLKLLHYEARTVKYEGERKRQECTFLITRISFIHIERGGRDCGTQRAKGLETTK